MNRTTFLLRSLTHHWRIHFAVGLGVAVATAVLTGALLVGDSVRGSLLELTTSGLGRIDEVMLTPTYFREELASELAADDEFPATYTTVEPAIVYPTATLEKSNRGGRTSDVFVAAVRPSFYSFYQWKQPPPELEENQIMVNSAVAQALQLSVGDEITLRLEQANAVAADSTLGRKADRTESLPRLEVVYILSPDEGMNRLTLHPTQQRPLVAYISLAATQHVLDLEGQVNAIFLGGENRAEAPSAEATARLEQSLQPKLIDYGYRLEKVERTYQPADAEQPIVAHAYYNLTTQQMMFPTAASESIAKALEPYEAQAVLTYLANTIEHVPSGKTIPYSTVSALNNSAELGPVEDLAQPLAANEIVLPDWAINQENFSEAEIGDTIRLHYFQPETSHGDAIETTSEFTLAKIVPLTEPAELDESAESLQYDDPAFFDQPPSLATDPHFTPEVEGVTDSETVNSWNPPFPYDRGRIRVDVDEPYWENYRATPKAFVSLAAGREIWSSRFGNTTSFRIPAGEKVTAEGIEAAILDEFRQSHLRLGFQFQHIKQNGIRAATGTTPFNALFLGFSFFIIAAAVMLVALLFRLGVEQRATQVGMLSAMGLSRKVATGLFVREGAIVAGIGGLLGIALGVGYASAMIAALTSPDWWLAAVSTPFLRLHVSWLSLLIGYVIGVLISCLAIWYTMRSLRSVSVRSLMAGQSGDSPSLARKKTSVWSYVAFGLIVLSLGLAVLATGLGGEAQAGAFFGSGSAILAALLLLIWGRLQGARAESRATFGVIGLASRNAGRNPGRSTLTIGLVAASSFLIIAISAFRLTPTSQGAGGARWVGESSQPLFIDWRDSNELGKILENWQDLEPLQDKLGPEVSLAPTVLPLRVKPGDDASCNNLYQANNPRVLGVTDAMIDHYNRAGAEPFMWAASAAESEYARQNPWNLFLQPTADDAPIPAVLDKNTAMYGLHLYSGVGETFEVDYPDRPPITFQVVGLLSNSVLQGSILIGEENFERVYPEISGYRYFLIEPPEALKSNDQALASYAANMEEHFSDQGLDLNGSRQILDNLLAVQNTYLSTFQSLGALGLLLGTFGLAAVQLRSILERRGELALLRATGFRRRRLAEMVLCENVALLIGGLAVGTLAALVAVVPHYFVGGVTAPLTTLAIMLGTILIIGLGVSLVAVRRAVRAPVVSALRGE